MFEQQILGFPVAEKHKYSALWTVAELVDVCFVSSSSHPHCFVFLLILLLLRSVLVWVTPALLQLSMIRICLSGYCWQIGSDTLLATPQGAHATTAARQGRHNIINRWQQWGCDDRTWCTTMCVRVFGTVLHLAERQKKKDGQLALQHMRSPPRPTHVRNQSNWHSSSQLPNLWQPWS